MAAPERVIVVGAGPVGLVAATALSAQAIPVTIVEAHEDVPEDLRASTFHPPTLDLLDRFGISQELLPQGLVCPIWQFRDRRQGVIANFDLSVLADVTAYPYRLQCEQWKLTRLLRARLQQNPDVTFHYGAAAADVTQTEDGVTLTLERRDGSQETISGSYLIGADGGRSAIRKLTGTAFDGITMPEVFLSLSTTFKFDDVIPDLADIAYMSDPDEWLVLLRTPTLWRALFPVKGADRSDSEITAPANVERMLQSVHAKDTPYEVVHTTAYRVHERVAENYVHGRIVLAGDAAHLNNPLGGMGMNGGIHDAINLADKLGEVCRGGPRDLLGRYERQRRKVAIETVQSQALRNRQILNERDEAKRQAYYADLRATADNPARHREYVMRSSMIQSLRDLEAVA